MTDRIATARLEPDGTVVLDSNGQRQSLVRELDAALDNLIDTIAASRPSQDLVLTALKESLSALQADLETKRRLRLAMGRRA